MYNALRHRQDLESSELALSYKPAVEAGKELRLMQQPDGSLQWFTFSQRGLVFYASESFEVDECFCDLCT